MVQVLTPSALKPKKVPPRLIQAKVTQEELDRIRDDRHAMSDQLGFTALITVADWLRYKVLGTPLVDRAAQPRPPPAWEAPGRQEAEDPVLGVAPEVERDEAEDEILAREATAEPGDPEEDDDGLGL